MLVWSLNQIRGFEHKNVYFLCYFLITPNHGFGEIARMPLALKI